MTDRIQAVRLEDAVLCMDCHLISNSDMRCRFCESAALLVISRVIGQMPRQTTRVIDPNDIPTERTDENDRSLDLAHDPDAEMLMYTKPCREFAEAR